MQARCEPRLGRTLRASSGSLLGDTSLQWRCPPTTGGGAFRGLTGDSVPSTLPANPDTTVDTAERLEALYGQIAGAALVKVANHVTDDYARLIASSPFAVLATVGLEGLDCSPRGDRPGFIRVWDENTAPTRPAWQQPHRQPAQHCPRPASSATLPDPRRRHHLAGQWPCADQRRAGASGLERYVVRGVLEPPPALDRCDQRIQVR
jgi:hypothetical protein